MLAFSKDIVYNNFCVTGVTKKQKTSAFSSVGRAVDS